MAGVLADGLEVDEFGDFELGGIAVGDGTDADDNGEMADTAVQFCEQGGSGGRIGGRVDEEGGGLPLLGSQPNLVNDGLDLGWEGTAVFHVNGYIVNVGDGLPSEGGDLFLLRRRDGVGKVENDGFSICCVYLSCCFCLYFCLWRVFVEIDEELALFAVDCQQANFLTFADDVAVDPFKGTSCSFEENAEVYRFVDDGSRFLGGERAVDEFLVVFDDADMVTAVAPVVVLPLDAMSEEDASNDDDEFAEDGLEDKV